jgi:hypothetical protein
VKNRIVLAVTAVALASCAPHRQPPAPAAPPHDYPGILPDPSTIPGDFMARQDVEARYGEQKIRFQAVLQKRGNTLTLLGMTPFGTRAFLLQQIGADVTFTPYMNREMPFPPKNILLDVDRAFFEGLSQKGASLEDGEHAMERDGEEIRETWLGGRVLERHFRRLDGNPAGEIDITYGTGMTGTVPPAAIKFHNGWFGYDLSIDTRSYQPLAPQP